jgi:outer membrane protein OmpA-like peptidoglycan-associated protein
MKSNPQIKIELRSHTDCRGSKPYNQRLSQLRAKAAVEYLTQNGIASSRMIARGYGESKLLNQCSCEGNQIIECTEEQHQANRRTEFKILSKNPDSELSQNKK